MKHWTRPILINIIAIADNMLHELHEHFSFAVCMLGTSCMWDIRKYSLSIACIPSFDINILYY